MPFQPPTPFIPYYPPVFPQAKRKGTGHFSVEVYVWACSLTCAHVLPAVAFIGPRGSGKATLFYLLKFGRMFRGTGAPKQGGDPLFAPPCMHCHDVGLCSLQACAICASLGASCRWTSRSCTATSSSRFVRMDGG